MKKNNWLIIVVIIAIIALLTLAFLKNKTGSNPLTTGGILNNKQPTARQILALAKIAANNKIPGAYLIGLTSTSGQSFSNGSSKNWYFHYLQPSTEKIYKIIVREGIVTEAVEDKANYKEKITEDFIDTSEAVTAAKNECNGATEGKYFYSLYAKSSKYSTPFWRVTCNLGENKNLAVIVDVLTGKVLGTQKVGIGW